MIRLHQRHDLLQFAFQGGFDIVGLTLAAGDAAHVRRIDFELAGHAAIETTDQGRQIIWNWASIAFVMERLLSPGIRIKAYLFPGSGAIGAWKCLRLKTGTMRL